MILSATRRLGRPVVLSQPPAAAALDFTGAAPVRSAATEPAIEHRVMAVRPGSRPSASATVGGGRPLRTDESYLVRADEIRDAGGSRIAPAHGWTLVDEGVVWHVDTVAVVGSGVGYRLECSRSDRGAP